MNAPAQATFKPPRSLILIGASTGGTRVLTHLISLLPPLQASIVIVQHMPKFINDSFIRTLRQYAAAKVCLAADGESLREGSVFLAPSEQHCTLVDNRSLRLAPGAKVNYVCPSVDVLMQSARPPQNGQRLIGVLLTGMGKDGAAGLAHIKRLGGLTIAQNESTCAVYGMPAQAAQLGCVDYELAPEDIAEMLAARAGVGKSTHD